MDPVVPPNPANMLFKWPKDQVGSFWQPYIRQTAQQAISAYIAGLLVPPNRVALLTSSVEVVHRTLQEEMRFCFIFHLKSDAAPDPTDTVMVRIASEPPVPGQQFNDMTPMQHAEVFVWGAEKGWVRAFTFEHRASRIDHTPMLDTPPQPVWPTPDPLSGI